MPMRPKVGCFALTEPDHGSDIAGGLAATAEKTADGWVINGAKRPVNRVTFYRHLRDLQVVRP